MLSCSGGQNNRTFQHNILHMRHNSALFCTQAPQFGSALELLVDSTSTGEILVFAYHPEKVGAKTNVHKSYKKKPVRFKVNVISRSYNYHLVGEMNVFCTQVKVYRRIFLGISE